ncbi:hypothetical protein OHM04_002691 [Enterococcus faecium]|nr:hypothetical protein [Enterococcus faecium]TVT07667.1 hypothetical protein FNV40_08130 [Enterococcus durans]
MSGKADYTICSTPSYISFDCPRCDEHIEIDWKKIAGAFGEGELYYGNCGAITCQNCGHDIELGDAEYD